ncbi:hypothetical protein COOONC_11927 [Cooperia oncophora]
MRFSAVLSEQGNVESFAKCVGAVAKMCKKQCGLRITEEGLCFVANETLQGQGNFLSTLWECRERKEVKCVLELDNTKSLRKKWFAGSC